MAETSHNRDIPDNLRRWVEHIRRLADPVVGDLDLSGELRAALARPRWIGGPLLAWRWVREHGSLAREFGEADWIASRDAARDDAALWWALIDARSGPVARWIDVDADGALFEQGLYGTIEVWTETELCALHALWHHASREAPGGAMAQRVARAVAWHVENTQPDNATNHPWAAHVFLRHGTPESQHFAETLLSNCMVLNGRPDPLSAWILLDAAEGLAQVGTRRGAGPAILI